MLSQDSSSVDQMSHLILVDVVHDPRQHVPLHHRKRRQLRLHLIPEAPTKPISVQIERLETGAGAERSLSIASRRLSTRLSSAVGEQRLWGRTDRSRRSRRCQTCRTSAAPRWSRSLGGPTRAARTRRTQSPPDPAIQKQSQYQHPSDGHALAGPASRNRHGQGQSTLDALDPWDFE